MSTSNITRRNFLAATAVSADLLGLVGCNVAPLDEDSQATLKEGMRAGVSRANANADNYAGAVAWINAVHGERDGREVLVGAARERDTHRDRAEVEVLLRDHGQSLGNFLRGDVHEGAFR